MIRHISVSYVSAAELNSFRRELEFKPEPPILSDQALNFAFTISVAKWS